jgi:hypothetical protein
MSNTLDNAPSDQTIFHRFTLLPQISHPFPRICVASRQIHTIFARSANNRRKYAILPSLGENASARFVGVLVVYAICNLARIGGVVNRARFPLFVVVELALEAERMVNTREAELNIGALSELSASNKLRRLEGLNSLLERSCHA